MSQPASCNKCKDAGFPDEKIRFEKNGTKPDGSIKWKVVNTDGSAHVHKEAAKPEQPKQATETQQRKLLAVLTGELAKTFIEQFKRGSSLTWENKTRDGVAIFEVYEDLGLVKAA